MHWVGDAIQSAHPLPSPSPPAFHLSLHQGLFQWVSSSHQVAKVLELQLQHQSFQCPLGLTGLIALQSKGLSRVFYNTTVRKHQFFSAHLQNTFLCILHLFPFRIFPLPRPSAVCLFALFMELIWWTDRPSSFQYVQFIFCVLCAVEVVVLLVFWQTFSVVCKCRFPTFSLKCA